MEERTVESITQELKDSISNVLIDLWNKTYQDVAMKYGKEAASWYTTGISEAHFTILGQTLKEGVEKRKND